MVPSGGAPESGVQESFDQSSKNHRKRNRNKKKKKSPRKHHKQTEAGEESLPSTSSSSASLLPFPIFSIVMLFQIFEKVYWEEKEEERISLESRQNLNKNNFVSMYINMCCCLAEFFSLFLFFSQKRQSIKYLYTNFEAKVEYEKNLTHIYIVEYNIYFFRFWFTWNKLYNNKMMTYLRFPSKYKILILKLFNFCFLSFGLVLRAAQDIYY